MDPLRDPLGYDVPLPHSGCFHPIGFPLSIETNAPEVLRLAASLWSRWRPRAGFKPARLRVVVSDKPASLPLTAGMPRGQGHLICVNHSPENFAICDVQQSLAWINITRDVALDVDYLRYHFLEMVVYLMVDAAHLAPIHGACVAWRDKAIVLCGSSGAGKTSLAYACARLGWTYLSDDATHVIRGSDELRVAGRPFHIRFRESARALFPELQRFTPKRRPNGKLDIEVETSSLNLKISAESAASHVVFLNRHASGASAAVEEYPAARAFDRLQELVCYGDETIRRAQAVTLRGLLRLPVRQLTYGEISSAESALRALAESPAPV